MRIYVDFDDCLSESARGFSDLAAELFGVHVPYEEMRFFNLQKAFSLTDEQYAKLLVEGHEPQRLLSYEEVPGASEAVHELMRRGHEVSVVTGRPFSSREPSRLWLDRHGLEDIRMYFLDKYGRESHRKENEYCLDLDDFYRMKFDYAVEDSPSAFLCRKICMVCFFNIRLSHIYFFFVSYIFVGNCIGIERFKITEVWIC